MIPNATFEDTGIAIQKQLLSLLPKLGDMNWLYENMNVPEKQMFLNLVGAQSKWEKIEGGYRTPKFYRLFSYNLLEMSKIGVLKVEELCPKIGQSSICTRSGT